MKSSSSTTPEGANYGAVPVAEADHITTAQVVEGSPSVVKLVAPQDLPEGYEFQVEVLGHRMVATVPQGGVQKGQEFHAFVTPVGAWKDGIWDCFSVGMCHMQCCLTYCCTPIALGQVLSRLNLNILASPTRSFEIEVSAFVLMIALVIVYVAVDMILQALIVPYLTATEQDDETGQIYTADELYTPPWVSRLQTLRQIWELAYGLFIFVVLIRTRQYVRQRYHIPTATCCGDLFEDCCCACFCGPCTVCQMARHTADYRRQWCGAACCAPCHCACCETTTDYRRVHKATCCTATGLVAASPLVV